MCGRFALASNPKAIAELFSLPEPPDFLHPRYNVAPSQKVCVVARKNDGSLAAGMVTWGLVPHWANSPNDGHCPVNARAETVYTNPVFREPFRSNRCLIPVSGFYEWQKTGTKPSSPKHPYHIRMKSGEPFAFAGLWDVWGEGSEKIVTCCTITVSPNDVLAPIHDRMPLIVPREDFGRWLSPDTSFAELLTMLTPYPAEQMEAYRVGKAVGNARSEGPECIARVVEERTLF